MQWPRVLTPFSWLWRAVAWGRRTAYALGLLHRYVPDLPVICVGNLSVGGTGKTPHVQVVCQLLLEQGYRPAILSRGYGRKSTGIASSNTAADASYLGDEPALLFQALEKKVPVVCSGPRVAGYGYIRKNFPACDVVVMDDGFQHLSIQPSFSIVLSRFDAPFFEDAVLPAGRLREPASQVSRADAVIFTSTPIEVTDEQKLAYMRRINRLAKVDLPVFFSQMKMSLPEPLGSPAVLLSGVAHNEAVLKVASAHYAVKKHLAFGDHHGYTSADMAAVTQALQAASESTILLTTAKDAVKLQEPELARLLPPNRLAVLGYSADLGAARKGFSFMIANHCRVLSQKREPLVNLQA